MRLDPTFALTQHREMVKALESPPDNILDNVNPAAKNVKYGSTYTPDYTNARLLHATLGCVTESAELADQMKKVLAYGKELDTTNIKEELGDLLWYVQLAAIVLGTTIEELLMANCNKLKVRYGDKFSFEKSQMENRDTDAERQAIENTDAA